MSTWSTLTTHSGSVPHDFSRNSACIMHKHTGEGRCGSSSLSSWHARRERSRVYSRTPVFSIGCLLPRIGRTDVQWSRIPFSGSDPRVVGSSWRSFLAWWRLANRSSNCTVMVFVIRIRRARIPNPNRNQGQMSAMVVVFGEILWGRASIRSRLRRPHDVNAVVMRPWPFPFHLLLQAIYSDRVRV